MKRGFTLIELLAVIVIIAIIATVGFYSITKIMNNARLDSLKDTALAVRKAANLYLKSAENNVGYINIDMTPNKGDNKDLIELSKDPWGKEYWYVLATAKLLEADTYEIIVYLGAHDSCYVLENNNIELANYNSCLGYTKLPTNLADKNFSTNIITNEKANASELRVANGVDTIGGLSYGWKSLGTMMVDDPSGTRGAVLEINDRLSNYTSWVILPYNLDGNSIYDLTVDVRGDNTVNSAPNIEGASINLIRYSDFVTSNCGSTCSLGASYGTPTLISGSLNPGSFLDNNGFHMIGGQDWVTIKIRMTTGPGDDWSTIYIGSSEGNGNSYYLDNFRLEKVEI